jgi:hypothetical protein
MICRNRFAALVLMMTACGGTAQSATDGSGGGTGGAEGASGASGAGGASSFDSGASVVCADDAGGHLASAARACTVDGDCTVLYGNTCCSQNAYGIAKTAVAAYGGCFWTDLITCAVDCVPPNSYRTDMGAMTPTVARGTDAKPYVAVRCTAGLCTTYALPRDAGADAAGDSAIQGCGSGFCRPAVMSSCGDPNAYAMPTWQCTTGNADPGYCCFPKSDCGASAFCASTGDCRFPMLLTQRGCGLEAGLGSCCVEPK